MFQRCSSRQSNFGASRPCTGCLDIAGFFATQNADGNRRCLAPKFLGGEKRTPDDAMAKMAVHVAEDGSTCSLMKSRQHAILLVRDANCIHPHVCIEDGRLRR